ncbi:isocitrate/isopropylmalate dehydrogenase family protein [Lujinxingia sediminis]|uniref:Isocitrate/isopropylmalate dehydrogenase family protein n=1 Tax=Lujinxingia sediminis TaxID=2480984 RepID=A0ABY0CQ74_9DELT|nr:isocitrate/isopropylmalate dehydrogenase family protein [Lujinxingia sediminis]RVU42320.1 isocitrate/isopropylmalate dehydrogenase family protein [Lujinxingia sediminis]
MSRKVSLIRGDGIGPEIVDATVSVIEALGVNLEWEEVRAGSGAYKDLGTPLPEETLLSIARNQCVLKGPLETPIGTGFRSINVAIRKHFDMYANVRPAKISPAMTTRFSDTKVDMVIVRENTEGAYAGIEHVIPPNRAAAETIILITRWACERIVRYAFEYARREGRSKVTLVHKANILKESNGLLLEVGQTIAREYDDIQFEDMIVDNCCMQMVVRPEQFDVIVTENLFGDILSDLAAGLIGGLGLTPGANIGEGAAMFEAVHGTAPDIAGKGIANPTALMRSAGMMLGHLGYVSEGKLLEKAITKALASPSTRTGDLGGTANTKTYTQALISAIQEG